MKEAIHNPEHEHITNWKTVTLKMERHEEWYPKCRVPAHLDEVGALRYCYEHYNDWIYDEYLHKYTYEAETHSDIHEIN